MSDCDEGDSETVAEREARTSALAIARKVIEREKVRVRRSELAKLLDSERSILGLQGEDNERFLRVVRVLLMPPAVLTHEQALVLAIRFLGDRGIAE